MPSLKAIADDDFARLARHVPVAELQCRTILLTGATGFFGAWLLALFGWLNSTKQANVTVLAVSRNPARFLERYPDFENASWLNWIQADVRDFPFPAGSIDYVLHAATDTSAEAGRNPSLLLDTIVEGTRHVLACARECNVKRTLLVSSGAIYGGQSPDVTHLTEDTRTAPSPLDIGQAYGTGKRTMELLGAIHAGATGTDVVVARCFAFVGAGLPLNGHFAIGNFIRDALSGEQIAISGGGTAERSYLYAADLAIWLVRLLVSGKSGNAYNVGSDLALSIADLARAVASVLAPGKPVVIKGWDDPTRGRNRYIPSIEKARSDCGLDVWTKLEQAVALTAVF